MTAITSSHLYEDSGKVTDSVSEDVYVLPSSIAQQRFWLLDQIDPGNTSLNMPLAFNLIGDLNVGALARSINEIVSRHEVLRTTFTTEDDSLVQVIVPELWLNLEEVDISDLADAEREERLDSIRVDEAHITFDLNKGPLLKVKLVKLGPKSHILLVTMHHIVCDGWSNGVLVRELGEIYGAFSRGLESPLPDLPIQYGDFALWQQQWLESESFDEQLAYWKGQLGNELPTLELPTDFPRKRSRSSFGAIESLLLSHALTRALKALGQREDVTTFMIFLAAFKVLLYRYSGQQEILIGSPTANRIQSETEGLIGAFANTLMLKTDLSGEPSFQEALQRIKDMSLGAFSNQSLPFEKLVEEIKPAQARSSNQLFQVLFIFQTAFMQPVHLDGLTISPIRSVSPGSIFDLSLGVVERAEGVRLQMEYNTELFEASTISLMLGHLQSILQSVVIDIRRKISEIPLLTQQEQDALLVERNRTEEDFPQDRTLNQLIELQAVGSPEKAALVSAGKSVSYRELTKRADEVAYYLQSLGVKPEERIGICLDSLSESAIALLGALKAGCVAVPLSREMMAPLTCRFIIGKGDFAQNAAGAELIDMDNVGGTDGANSLPLVVPEGPAVVVFGEDGKGAVVTHRALIARSTAIIKQAQLSSADTVAIPANLHNCSTLEMILAALIAGADLRAVHSGSSTSGILDAADKARASVVALPVAAFHRLSGEDSLLSTARMIIVSGGRIAPSSVRKWFEQRRENTRLLVSYGTPATGCAAAIIEPAENYSSFRINRPSPNAQIYVLDRNLQPVPAGVYGEIFVSGELVASSRLDEDGINNIAFAGKKIYGAGDVARYLKGGEIEILGTVGASSSDLLASEIEDALLSHSSVLEALVAAREDRLIAYIVLREGENTDETMLRHLIEERTGTVQPLGFVNVMSLPLTPQGNLDYDALPDAETESAVTVESKQTEEVQDDHIENELKDIWKELLGVSSVGIRDDFFKLGGHSLAAAQVFAQIKKRLGVNLPLTILFSATTIEQLARIIREEKPKEEWSSLVPINPNGSKPRLFVVHAAGGNVLSYKELAARLGADQPFYGLQQKGLDGKQKSHERIEDMAAHYINEIKGVQPQGPYFLGGASFGGLVAYEMARQLREQGEEIAIVALFDTYAPGYPRFLPDKSKLTLAFWRLFQRVEHHVETIWMLDRGERWSYIAAKAKKAKNQTRRNIRSFRKNLARGVLNSLGIPLPDTLKETQNAVHIALRNYQPLTYAGTVTLFRCNKQPIGIYPDPTLGWGELVTGRLEIHEVPGTHGTLVHEPRVRFLVGKLEECLEDARSAEPAMAISN